MTKISSSVSEKLQLNIELFGCPNCFIGFNTEKDRPALSFTHGILSCPVCKRIYSISRNILHLLPDYKQLSYQGQAHQLIDFYDNQYIVTNPNWHQEDSDSKIRELYAVIPKSNLYNSILEVGCGAGLILRSISTELNSSYSLGLDISKKALKIASNQAPQSLFLNADTEHIPIRSKKIDLIINADVIEHTLNPAAMLREQSRICKFAVFRVPIERAIYTNILSIGRKNRYKKLRKKYGHIHHYSRKSLEDLITSNNFEILHRRSAMIPNRKGTSKILQDWTYSNFKNFYPLLWGGFDVIFARAKEYL